eukprot:gene9228-19141_t
MRKGHDPCVIAELYPPTLYIGKNWTASQINNIVRLVGPYSVTEYHVKANVVLRTFLPLILSFCGIFFMSHCQLKYLGLRSSDHFNRIFMGNFFVLFSAFKLNNLHGFANAYAAYDIIAKRWKPYAYAYPFLELIIGILYLTNRYAKWVNGLTLLIMSISSVGVYQALRQGKELQCACMGTWFNLPMTYVTLLEDTVMVAMALFGLLGRH